MNRAHAWSLSSIVLSAVVAAGSGAAVTGCASTASTAPGGAELPTATCGRALTRGLSARTEILSAGKTALTCFSAAARACEKASLQVTEMGVDTGTQYVFAITAQGKPCQITELTQSYSANFGGSTGPISTTGCQVTAAATAGVTLTCAGQKLLIPVSIASMAS